MSIGSNIKALREDRKLTQEQVAEALGISFQAVSSWERTVMVSMPIWTTG